MTAKKTEALTNVTAIPKSMTSAAAKFMPRQRIEQLDFWEKLKGKEQEQLLELAEDLSGAMLAHGSSGLAIGKHLTQAQEMLRPQKKAFAKFLRNFRFTERSAYRYIIAYENASERLPEAVLQRALARGMNILGYQESKPLGKYTGAFEILKPLNPDPEVADKVLDDLEKTYKDLQANPVKREAMRDKLRKRYEDESDEIRNDPEFLQMQWYRIGKNAMRRVSSRRRRGMLDDVVGYWLTELGITTQQTFKAQAIPDKFRQERGRPKVIEGRKAAEAASA